MNIIEFPGFVDIQVNGCFGHDVNNAETLSPKTLDQMCAYQLRKGVSKWFPTIISNSTDRITKILEIIARARQENELIEKSIPGVHLEIYVARQAMGCHNERYLRDPSWVFIESLFQEGLGSLIKIITIAPELDSSFEFIQEAVKNKIVVAVGHTLADYPILEKAYKAGARLSTHLGNGIPELLNRTNNPIISQLELPFKATLIADGYHITPYGLRCLIRLKGVENTIIITDSIFAAGSNEGSYALNGMKITVSKGKAFLTENPHILAGSVTTMPDEFSVLKRCGFENDEIIAMTSSNVISLFGLEQEPNMRLQIEGSRIASVAPSP